MEPVVNIGAALNGYGNTFEGVFGINYDRAFSFYLGGMTLINYQGEGDKTNKSGIKGLFVRGFINLIGLANSETRMIFGPQISVGLFKQTNYILNQRVNGAWKLKTPVAFDLGYQAGGHRIVFTIKYLDYEDIYGEKTGNVYFGVSYGFVLNFKMNKEYFRPGK